MIKKVLLIDANNLAFRVHWSHRNLTHDGVPVSLIYGFMRSMISFRRRFEEYFPVIVWDSKSQRRIAESSDAVSRGIIDSAYKENRKIQDDEDIDPMFDSLFQQIQPLKEGLNLCRVMQVVVDGYEADDVIHTYAKQNSEKNIESLMVTSDKDYYQILKYPKTSIYDAMKSTYWTKEIFIKEYGIDPSCWVDVGALAGDASDNIHGVPGVGLSWAVKFIKEYGDLDGVFNGIKAKEKRKKKEQSVLDHHERVMIAKSLKQMDVVDGLPSYRSAPRKVEPIKEWFRNYMFNSLIIDAWRLV
jgi:DNA polymerase-1